MNDRSIAYSSMEMALRPDMPTYSGGLGVLAGDTIRSAADLKLPMAAMRLHRRSTSNGTVGSALCATPSL